MKRAALLVLLAAAPLLTAAIWMDDQPSHREYEAPVLTPPAGAVPVQGRETPPPPGGWKNPVPSDRESVDRGRKLFDTNCAFCHGRTSAARGPVGMKLNPPAPGLDPAMVRDLSDAFIFNAVTSGFGRMPSFKSKLSPRERWDLVNFLRARK